LQQACSLFFQSKAAPMPVAFSAPPVLQLVFGGPTKGFSKWGRLQNWRFPPRQTMRRISGTSAAHPNEGAAVPMVLVGQAPPPRPDFRSPALPLLCHLGQGQLMVYALKTQDCLFGCAFINQKIH
jgi:hypothetical protein